MKRRLALAAGWSAALFTLAGPAFGLDQVDSMRCRSKLVMIGDTKFDVLSRCGEPAGREKIVRAVSSGKSKKPRAKEQKPSQAQESEQWIYNLGPTDFIYTLTFEGVELKAIGRGGRGTRPSP